MEQWIKYFHFKKDVLSEVDYSFDVVGQEEIVNELLYRVQAGDLVFVEGSLGSGKTSLLQEIIKKYRGKQQVVYLDCKNLTKGVDMEKLLIEKFGWLDKLLKKFPMEMIVLLDNIQKLDHKNSEAIKYFFDQGNIKSVIFTSENRVKVKFSGSLWQRIGRRVIQIRPLKEKDAIKMMKNRIGSHKINNAGLKILYENSNGDLKIFLADTKKTLQYMADNSIYSIDEDELEEKIYGKSKKQEAEQFEDFKQGEEQNEQGSFHEQSTNKEDSNTQEDKQEQKSSTPTLVQDAWV